MPQKPKRIQSIDMMRGICLLVMTLGHTRDHLARLGETFFGAPSPLPVNPVDMAYAGTVFFWLRCLSHMVVPPFLFLAGTGSYLWQQRGGEGRSLLKYLFLRGGMLAAVNCVLFSAAPFSPGGSVTLHVLWPIGIAMMLLGLIARFPAPLLLCVSLTLIAGQNVFETVTFESPTLETLWVLAFKTGTLRLPWGAVVDTLWPVMPWFGIMLLGYSCGGLFLKGREKIRTLFLFGLASLVLFAFLRVTGLYGDPNPWRIYGDPLVTASTFLNVTKYPPSLQFTLYGLGSMCLIMAFLEKFQFTNRMVLALGSAPLFYYIAHIICLRASKFVMLQFPVTFWFPLKGVVFSLGGFLTGGFLIALFLWPLCEMYTRAAKKRARTRRKKIATGGAQ